MNTQTTCNNDKNKIIIKDIYRQIAPYLLLNWCLGIFS